MSVVSVVVNQQGFVCQQWVHEPAFGMSIQS